MCIRDRLHLKNSNIAAFVTGAVQPKLNQGNMNRIPLTLPPPAIGEAFARTIGPLFEQIRANTDQSRTLATLRDTLLERLRAELPDVRVNGSLAHRLPNNLNVSFAYVEGESLIMAVKDIAVSSGSACTSASLEPSYVLRALGIGEELAHTSIRFGIGRFNTEAEIDYTIELVVKAVSRLRELSPLWEMVQDGIDLSRRAVSPRAGRL